VDHLAAQRRVEGEVEQEAQVGAQELLVIAGNQPRQLLHGERLRLQTTDKSTNLQVLLPKHTDICNITTTTTNPALQHNLT